MKYSKTKTFHELPRSSCGRTGCVAIYRAEDCHLCDVAGEYLKELMKEEGLSESIIKIIDELAASEEPTLDEIRSRPAIRVCETVMTGIPDDERMRNSLRRAATMNCFSSEMV